MALFTYRSIYWNLKSAKPQITAFPVLIIFPLFLAINLSVVELSVCLHLQTSPSFSAPPDSSLLNFAHIAGGTTEFSLQNEEAPSVESHETDAAHEDRFTGSKCDIFTGNWVHDISYPLYDSAQCPYLDGEVSCRKNGRPDIDYERWRWNPRDCRIPRFNALYLLQRIRGKTLMFVGDSLNRDQWQSMICLLQSPLAPSKKLFSQGDPISTFKALDYGVSISFYRAPYLVDLQNAVVQNQKKTVLRLDSIENNARSWRGVDILVFNSGHWWTHTGNIRGWDFMQEGNRLYTSLDPMVAYQKGLTTWANWIDSNIDALRTRVFFQSISPTHYSPREWNNPNGRSCYGETEPILGFSYPGPFPAQMQVLQGVIGRMKSPVYLLNITTLSQLRKDAHPSVYGGDLTVGQRKSPERYSDCSHWCLPGLPDTWNELLYAALVS